MIVLGVVIGNLIQYVPMIGGELDDSFKSVAGG